MMQQVNKTLLKSVGSALSSTARHQNLLAQRVSNSSKLASGRSFSNKGTTGKDSDKAAPKVASTPKAVATTVGGFDNIKQQLVSLANKEVKNLNAEVNSQFSGAGNDAQIWLNNSGFKLSESDDGLHVLSKDNKDVSIRVHFSPSTNDEDENPETLGEEEDDLENVSDSDAEVKADKTPSSTLSFEAELLFKNPQGEFKGGMIFTGEVGEDCRLYVNDIQASPELKTHMIPIGSEETKKPKFYPTALFDKLSQDFQDRFYDLLDEVGIDDKMGSYMKYYVDTAEPKQAIEVFETLKKILA